MTFLFIQFLPTGSRDEPVLFNFAFYLMNRNFSIPFLPDSAMWYLYALIIYRLVLPLAIKTRLIIPVSFSVSLLMNFIGFQLDSGTATTIKYFPFFLLGYYVQINHIMLLRKINKLLASIILFVGIAIILFVLYVFNIEINEYILFVHSEPLGIKVFLGRCCSLLFGVLFSVYLIVIIPNKSMFFTKIGKLTIVIYLFHYLPLIRKVYQFIIPVQCLGETYVFFISIAMSIFVVVILSLKPVVWFYNTINNLLTKNIVKKGAIK